MNLLIKLINNIKPLPKAKYVESCMGFDGCCPKCLAIYANVSLSLYKKKYYCLCGTKFKGLEPTGPLLNSIKFIV